jgi:hypothetical protein
MGDPGKWLISNKTWLKWLALDDGGMMKYNYLTFSKPKDVERLKNHILMIKM